MKPNRNNTRVYINSKKEPIGSFFYAKKYSLLSHHNQFVLYIYIMKKLLLLFLLSYTVASFAQLTNDDYKQVVVEFINTIKNKNQVLLDSMIRYPISRQYPLPDIKDKTEMQQRFKEVFDDILLQKIINSNPAKDWSDVGWRGIMLNNGELWLDYDGSLLAVNHQSEWEAKKRLELIEADRSRLHPSLQKYVEPICILKTKKFLIRIDRLENYNYRYASWSVNKLMSDQPDLVISKGELIFEGSGGNHHYEFKNGAYTYECSIIIMGEDDAPPANITVTKGKKEILSQDADILEP